MGHHFVPILWPPTGSFMKENPTKMDDLKGTTLGHGLMTLALPP